MGKTIQLTEADLHNMVLRAVQNIRESFGFGGGFDETMGGFDEGGKKSDSDEKAATPDDGRPGDSDSKKAQQKRSDVLDALRRTDDESNDSDVRRRKLIYRLYNVSTPKEYDTYRSLFSKCVNAEDSAHQFSDGQINIIYDMISDIL